jgi:hypothetical protein
MYPDLYGRKSGWDGVEWEGRIQPSAEGEWRVSRLST